MNNIQDILNRISTSEISRPDKIGGLTNIAKRKPIFVFYKGNFVEKLPSLNKTYKKYGRNLVGPILKRNRPISGYYFSRTNEYKPNKVWENLKRNQTIIVFQDSSEMTFPTMMSCAEYLGMNRANLYEVKKETRKLPKRFSHIKEIIFCDSK